MANFSKKGENMSASIKEREQAIASRSIDPGFYVNVETRDVDPGFARVVQTREIDPGFYAEAKSPVDSRRTQTNAQVKRQGPDAKTKVRGVYIDIKKINGQYYAFFKYAIEEDADKMRGVVETLLEGYGALSSRYNHKNGYIMPRLVDKHTGQTVLSEHEDGMVGDMAIPADLLPDFVKRFVEVDDAVVTIGKETLVDEFDQEKFDRGIESLDHDKNDKHEKTNREDKHQEKENKNNLEF